MQGARCWHWLVIAFWATATACSYASLPPVPDGGGGPGGGSDRPGLALLAGDIGGSGNEDGAGTVARFNSPRGIATDSSGIYVADGANNAIRSISLAGDVTTIAGGTVGVADGTGSAAQFSFPQGVTVDGQDRRRPLP
jgi:hypothetical protein